MSHFFAQVNVARMLLSLDHPQMADFVNNTARINAIAEKRPGFLWRWNEGDETSDTAKIFNGPNLVVKHLMHLLLNRIILPRIPRCIFETNR